jgi:hypothetical protein
MLRTFSLTPPLSRTPQNILDEMRWRGDAV